MGVFDWYQPATPPTCDICRELMTFCQGKDGPCYLTTWKEGEAPMAIEQRIEEPLDRLEGSGLPKRFTFSCWCPKKHRRDFVGECVDGVWARTVPGTVLEAG